MTLHCNKVKLWECPESTMCRRCCAALTHTCTPESDRRCFRFVHRARLSQSDLRNWNKLKAEQERKEQIIKFFANLPKWVKWAAYSRRLGGWYCCVEKPVWYVRICADWYSEDQMITIPSEYEPTWLGKVSVKNSLIQRPS